MLLGSPARRGNFRYEYILTIGSNAAWVGCRTRLFGLAAYYSHTFGTLVKGEPAMLVQNGRIQRKNMFRNHISKHDLGEDMRLEAKTDDLSKIQVARLERSGDISFIKAE